MRIYWAIIHIWSYSKQRTGWSKEKVRKNVKVI